MKFDIHTHHSRCGHADGHIRDYVESAIQAGLSVIGISDHTPYFGHAADHPFPHIAMAKKEFANYVEEVLAIKQEYKGQIDVLLGIESDFFPEHVDAYRKVIESYPFDYVIGSVHSVNKVSIFNKNRWKGLSKTEMIQTKKDYYSLIKESAKCGMFQILGHIDAMKGNYPAFSSIPADESIDETLQVIAEHQIAIEVNTSGKTKLSGGWYPSDDILARALRYGVDVTFGSDAHKPSRVGDEWEAVAGKLREIGFTHWVYYANKEKVSVPLQ